MSLENIQIGKCYKYYSYGELVIGLYLGNLSFLGNGEIYKFSGLEVLDDEWEEIRNIIESKEYLSDTDFNKIVKYMNENEGSWKIMSLYARFQQNHKMFRAIHASISDVVIRTVRIQPIDNIALIFPEAIV